MSFPWLFKSNFEAGTNAEWDSEQDTGTRLDFPHYSELARFPWSECAPYRGAYCMRVQMGDTNDHTVRENDVDIADTVTRYVSFYLYLAPNVAATADDTFNILELQQSGGGTVESSLGLRITAATGAIEIGIGDGTAPTDFAASTLTRNRWYHVELEALISTAGSGTLQLFVDNTSVVSLTSLTNAAGVGSADFGTQDTLSTTTGTILFDRFIFDDARIYPDRERFPRQMVLTKTGHVFVGPGYIESATLLTTGASNTMFLFDTDTANANDAQGRVVELDLSTHTSASGPWYFQRGCYVQLSGTNPRGQIQLPAANGPRYYSASGMRLYGLQRKQRVGNV